MRFEVKVTFISSQGTEVTDTWLIESPDWSMQALTEKLERLQDLWCHPTGWTVKRLEH